MARGQFLLKSSSPCVTRYEWQESVEVRSDRPCFFAFREARASGNSLCLPSHPHQPLALLARVPGCRESAVSDAESSLCAIKTDTNGASGIRRIRIKRRGADRVTEIRGMCRPHQPKESGANRVQESGLELCFLDELQRRKTIAVICDLRTPCVLCLPCFVLRSPLCVTRCMHQLQHTRRQLC